MPGTSGEKESFGKSNRVTLLIFNRVTILIFNRVINLFNRVTIDVHTHPLQMKLLQELKADEF